MVCTAMPRSSSAWKAKGIPAGARKYAEPSGSMGTVPRPCFPGDAFANPTRGELAWGVVFGST
mgnify:CR=1 FL=1